jgi:transcriptional regulator with GAF, ATPase, and Fis domain
MAYRHRTGHESGFATTDELLLRDAAANLGAFVYGLREADRTEWFKLDLDRYNKVRDVLFHRPPHETESTLLQAFSESFSQHFGFHHCAIYVPDPDGAVLRRCAYVKRQPEDTDLPLTTDSDRSLRCALQSRKPTQSRRPTTKNQDDPEQVRHDRIIQRVCLPIMVNGQAFGVVDLHWRKRPRYNDRDPQPLHHVGNLKKLVDNLGTVIEQRRTQSLRVREHAGRALSGIGAASRAANG